MTDIIKELEERGYIEQLTHEKEMRELFQKEQEYIVKVIMTWIKKAQ